MSEHRQINASSLGTTTLVLHSRHTLQLPCWAGTLSTSSVLISVSMHVVGKPISQRAQHPERASRQGLSINAWLTPLTGLVHLMAGPLPSGRLSCSLKPWLCRARTKVST